jgi:hypothetical protein
MPSYRNLFIGLAAATLVACGPVYKTTYELTPPQTAEGRLCTSQCQQTKSACQRGGYDRYQLCKERKQAHAERAYNDYRMQQLMQKKPIKKSRRHFYSGYSCRQEASYKKSCEQDFVGCFATCGGKVTPHTICTANCEKAAPPQQMGRTPPPANAR